MFLKAFINQRFSYLLDFSPFTSRGHLRLFLSFFTNVSSANPNCQHQSKINLCTAVFNYVFQELHFCIGCFSEQKRYKVGLPVNAVAVHRMLYICVCRVAAIQLLSLINILQFITTVSVYIHIWLGENSKLNWKGAHFNLTPFRIQHYDNSRRVTSLYRRTLLVFVSHTCCRPANRDFAGKNGSACVDQRFGSRWSGRGDSSRLQNDKVCSPDSPYINVTILVISMDGLKLLIHNL